MNNEFILIFNIILIYFVKRGGEMTVSIVTNHYITFHVKSSI